jgi:dipeptidyl aminopeptidase/acylaminoacyl peptidase
VLPWLAFFAGHDPLPVARRVKVSTLILQGATDRQVTAEQAEQLAAAIRAGGNRSVTVHVFPEANHLFVQDPDGNPSGYSTLSGVVRRDVVGVLADWLVDQFRVPR